MVVLSHIKPFPPSLSRKKILSLNHKALRVRSMIDRLSLICAALVMTFSYAELDSDEFHMSDPKELF